MMVLSGAVEGADPILTRIVEEDKVPWYKKPNLRKLYFLLFPTCMGIEITSGFDSQLINAAQGITAWKSYFGHAVKDAKTGKVSYVLDANLKGILAAAYSLGAICALPFVPTFSQRFGRRWAIFFGSTISVVGAILQGCAQDAAMYIIARMILGFGIPFCIINGSSLLGELGYPKERPTLTSLFNSSYFIGSVVAAAICLGTNYITGNYAWRVPSFLQAVPSLIQMCGVLFLPESPRYLISKDRRDEAFDILAKYHAEGDRDSLFVKAEMAQIETTIKLEMENAKGSYLDLFRTVGMRKRAFVATMLGLFTQWSGNTLISYYFSDLLNMVGVTDSKEILSINLGQQGWSLLCATVLALVVTRFRRRTMYMTCVISMLCVYISWTACTGIYQASVAKNPKAPARIAGKLSIFWIFAYQPAYNIGYNALTYTYMIELMPFAERSRGLALFQFFGRGATFFATFVNPIGLAAIGWKYFLVYVCWICFEIVIIWFFFPETYNRTLEELSFMFEGQDLVDKQILAVEKQIHHDDVNVEMREDTNAPAVDDKATTQQRELV